MFVLFYRILEHSQLQVHLNANDFKGISATLFNGPHSVEIDDSGLAFSFFAWQVGQQEGIQSYIAILICN